MRYRATILLAVGLGLGMPGAAPPALAQDFTTATEIKPILAATKSAWIAVREWDGNDLIYFTNALAWRCGLEAIHYGVNGAAPDTPFAMEPCYEGEATPNAIKTDQIYVTLALKSVETVTVRLTFDDGSEDVAEFQRAAVLTP